MKSIKKVNNKELGLIPARGDSDRVPKKNLIILMGEPLISFSIKETFKQE